MFSSDVADGSIDFVIIPETDLLPMFSPDVADCSTDSIDWVFGIIANFIAFSPDVPDGSIDFVIIPETGLAAMFSSDAGSDDPIDSVNWVSQK